MVGGSPLPFFLVVVLSTSLVCRESLRLLVGLPFCFLSFKGEGVNLFLIVYFFGCCNGTLLT